MEEDSEEDLKANFCINICNPEYIRLIAFALKISNSIDCKDREKYKEAVHDNFHLLFDATPDNNEKIICDAFGVITAATIKATSHPDRIKHKRECSKICTANKIAREPPYKAKRAEQKSKSAKKQTLANSKSIQLKNKKAKGIRAAHSEKQHSPDAIVCPLREFHKCFREPLKKSNNHFICSCMDRYDLRDGMCVPKTNDKL
jgi:hypothetical protein